MCLVIFSSPGQSKKNPHYKQTESHLYVPSHPLSSHPTGMFSHAQLGRIEARTTQPFPHHKLCSRRGFWLRHWEEGSCSGEELGSETNPVSLTMCPWARRFTSLGLSFHNCKMFSKSLKYTVSASEGS